jgi:streptomycin 6-kinase
LSKELNNRILTCVRAWSVAIERTVSTESSVVVLGKREGRPVALKVVKHAGDEWRCGEVAALFGGRGVVQVYQHVEGAALFERLDPGEPLAAMSLDGRDEEATEILAMMLGRMSPLDPPAWCPTVEQWGAAFAPYLAGGDERVPRDLVEPAQRIYAELCATQRNPGLLHGDLHHYNVLSDRSRGWCAIDPKGVVGELEYELAAALRNPFERPELYTSLDVFERRLDQFGMALGLDVGRARGWCFAQAVLSHIWHIGDGHDVDANSPGLRLARALLDSPALRGDFID